MQQLMKITAVNNLSEYAKEPLMNRTIAFGKGFLLPVCSLLLVGSMAFANKPGKLSRDLVGADRDSTINVVVQNGEN